MGLKRSVSIRQAMQYVADHPEMQSDELISLPVWELVVRTVFEAEFENMGRKGERGMKGGGPRDGSGMGPGRG